MKLYKVDGIDRKNYYSNYQLDVSYDFSKSEFLGSKENRYCIFCNKLFSKNKKDFKNVSLMDLIYNNHLLKY